MLAQQARLANRVSLRWQIHEAVAQRFGVGRCYERLHPLHHVGKASVEILGEDDAGMLAASRLPEPV